MTIDGWRPLAAQAAPACSADIFLDLACERGGASRWLLDCSISNCIGITYRRFLDHGHRHLGRRSWNGNAMALLIEWHRATLGHAIQGEHADTGMHHGKKPEQPVWPHQAHGSGGN